MPEAANRPAPEIAIEAEVKFRVPSGFVIPELPVAGGSGDLVWERPLRVSLRATYFDTDDLRLMRAGVTLRRRAGGADEGWHLKVPLAADRRTEMRLPLDAQPPRSRAVPPQLRDLVFALTRGRKLVPVASITTERDERRLVDRVGAIQLTVVDDAVTAAPAGGDRVRWREVEVEQGIGSKGLAKQVRARLRAAGAVRVATPSKLSAVLADRLSNPDGARHPVPAAADAGGVLVARLSAQVEELVRRDIEARRDAPDGVHKMRVASRRLRSALRTFGPLVDQERAARLSDELRWLATVLGAARDAEVLSDRLTAAIAGLPAEDVIGDAAARVGSRLGGDRERAQAELVKALTSRRYAALLESLEDWLTAPPLTAAAAAPIAEALQLVRREFKRTRRRARAVDTAQDADRDVAWHDLRKATKRLRYAAEAVGPVGGSDAAAFASAAERVQEVLGERQDAVTALALLREEGRAAHGRDGDNGYTYGVLAAREAALIAAAEQAFAGAWRQLARKKSVRWLDSAR